MIYSILTLKLDNKEQSPFSHLPQQKFNSTKLEKLVFYDSFSYELLHETKIGIRVEGDIETNRLSVSIDRDIVNIVSHKGTTHTVLVFRLKEDFPNEEDEEKDEGEDGESLQRNPQRTRNKGRKRSQEHESENEWEENEAAERRTATRKRRKRENRNRRLRKRNQRKSKESSVSESEDTDEWTP